MIKNFIVNKFADTTSTDTTGTCLICLDENNCKNYMMPTNCNCRIKIHPNCFNQIISIGLLCPICRIKSNSNNLSDAQLNNKLLFDISLISFYTIITLLFIWFIHP